MERDFEKELNENVLYQFLRSHSGCKIYWQSQGGEICATFGCTGSSVYYYWADGTYQRIEMTKECREFNSTILLDDVNKITRVEKEFEDKWLPVWTSIDGFIETDHQNFAYIHERYYTFKELEQMIDEVLSLKKLVANLKVY
ncbi:MAG: hypothetical protein IJ776_02235 [Paludibacteraceae bacterium]|nr:hypothetical protein [Paludibacteraceae bacterium]